MDTPIRCSARVFRGFRTHPCAKNSVKDGYCGTHHPDSVAKRKQAAADRDNAKLSARDAKLAAYKEMQRRAAAYPKLVAALRDLLAMVDAHPECREFRGGYAPFSAKTARELLATLAVTPPHE